MANEEKTADLNELSDEALSQVSGGHYEFDEMDPYYMRCRNLARASCCASCSSFMRWRWNGDDNHWVWDCADGQKPEKI